MASHLRSILVLGVLALTGACAKSDQKSDDKAAEPAPDDGDDGDTEVAQAVPMALLGTEYVANLGKSLGPGVATNEPAATPIDPTKEPLALAKATLNAGSRAAGQLHSVLGAMQIVLGSVFGADGFFRGKDVTFKQGVAERLFKQLGDDGKANAFLVVRLNPPESEYQFGVDLYPVDGEANAHSQVSVEFSPEGEGQSAKVRYLSATPVGDGDEQRIDSRFSTATSVIEATFGNLAAPDSVRDRTTARLEYDAASESVTVAGAYVWRRVGAEVSDKLPRYYSLVSGDVERFAMRSRLKGKAEGAQRLEFFPAEAKGSSPYPVHMTRFLVRLVRQADLNPDCATMGDVFRAAFDGKTVPPEVAAAPDDLCLTNSAYTDAELETLIATACAGGVDIPVSGLGVCSLNQENLLLGNPQLFYLADGARHLVLSPEPALPAHAALITELAAVKDVSTAPLGAPLDPMPLRPATDFDGAEDRPE